MFADPTKEVEKYLSYCVPLNGVDSDDVKEICIQRFLETSNISGIIISTIQICIDFLNYTPQKLQLYHRVLQLLKVTYYYVVEYPLNDYNNFERNEAILGFNCHNGGGGNIF